MHIKILHVAHNLLRTFISNKDMRKEMLALSALLCCCVILTK